MCATVLSCCYGILALQQDAGDLFKGGLALAGVAALEWDKHTSNFVEVASQPPEPPEVTLRVTGSANDGEPGVEGGQPSPLIRRSSTAAKGNACGRLIGMGYRITTNNCD